MKQGFVAATLLTALFAAGCQNSGPSPAPQIAAAPARSPVEGQWQGTDGVAVSTFTAGKFTSTSASTGETLTEGTYTEAPSGLIQLSFYSLRSQKNVAANCLIAEGQRLNCTLDSGTQFVLVRKAGV